MDETDDPSSSLEAGVFADFDGFSGVEEDERVSFDHDTAGLEPAGELDVTPPEDCGE